MDDSAIYIKIVGDNLNNAALPIKDRFRALFTLRNLGGSDSIDYISACFSDPSVLLRHELAFCLGQMQDEYAINLLKKILEDDTENVIVRHEAAEALGAIGSMQSLDVLKRYQSDPAPEVSETCDLAVNKIQWLHDQSPDEEPLPPNPYRSVDPAPPSENTDINQLQTALLDESVPLFHRYRCMFSLRNIGTDDCIAALARGLKCKKSALFRHEIAYVLGQLKGPGCVPQLIDRLADKTEHAMVRHECAEALGAIATSECVDILREYSRDDERVVRESCLVALDISEYETCPQFQYADSLTAATS